MLHSRDFVEGRRRPDEIFQSTQREAAGTKQNEHIPDQKVLLIYDQVTTFKYSEERVGANKNYEELLTTFRQHFDCEIMSSAKPSQSEWVFFYYEMRQYFGIFM